MGTAPGFAAREGLSRWNNALRTALGAICGVRGKALEAGCGAGRFIRAIKEARPDLEAHGCDLDPVSVARARRLGGAVSYLVADLSALPYREGSFDLVLLFDVLEHLRDPRLGLSEVRRVLKRGGVLHALVPCEGEPGTLHWLLWWLGRGAELKRRLGGHVQRFSKAGLGQLLEETGLTIQEVSYSMHPLGQVKDVLGYLERDGRFRGGVAQALYRGLERGLWPLAYGEARLLRRVSWGAVVAHVTCRAS